MLTENSPTSDSSPLPAANLRPQLPTASRSVPADEISVLELLNVLLKRWRILIALPLSVAVLVALISIINPATYTASTTFVPEVRTQGRLPSGIAGLAGQLGISLAAEPTESPRFYAAVVRSRELLERILASKYEHPLYTGVAPDSATLLQILEVNGRDSADSLHQGVKALDKLVSVRVDNQTNIVRLSVDARDPALAAAIANRFVAYLNDFNTKTRQSQARERRKFIEERLADGEEELRTTEERLRGFYERNRSWQQSPQLVFEEGRLRRQGEIRQEVYLTLRREYETARIEEVNDTPVITVIDPAAPPQHKSSPNSVLLVLFALVLGAIVTLCWALGAEYLERVQRADDPEYRQFEALLQQLRRAPGRAVRQLPGVKH